MSFGTEFEDIVTELIREKGCGISPEGMALARVIARLSFENKELRTRVNHLECGANGHQWVFKFKGGYQCSKCSKERK